MSQSIRRAYISEMDFDKPGAIGFSFMLHASLQVDSLIFEIDGVRADNWTAVYNWETVAYPVDAGTHTFRWTYFQGILGRLGTSAVYIDNVQKLASAQSVATKPNPGANPSAFTLDPAYPNPAHSQATISYSLPSRSVVKLIVYDALGREVLRVIDREQGIGVHRAELQTATWPAGVYFYRIQAEGFEQTRQLLVVH